MQDYPGAIGGFDRHWRSDGYRSTAWADDALSAALDRHEAKLGYTTSVWYNILTSWPLFNRSSWFAGLQSRARQPYPEELARAVIARTHPVLRQISGSFSVQILKAAVRGEQVSVHHRVAVFLGSYFDVLFALNGVPHPGEKRLLETAQGMPRVPPLFAARVRDLLAATVGSPATLKPTITALCNDLDECLQPA